MSDVTRTECVSNAECLEVRASVRHLSTADCESNLFTGHHKARGERLCRSTEETVKRPYGSNRRCQILYRSPQSVSNIFTSHQMACETSLQVTTKLVKRLYMSPQTISNFSQVTTERVSLYRSPQGVSNVFTGHHRACEKTVQVTTERVKPLYRSPKSV